jgi:hypothetical protein
MADMAERLRLRRSGLTWQAVEGEVIALDMSASHYLGANPSGSLLWEALGSGATAAELVALLVDRYGVQRAAAERDVAAFVAQLRDLGLLGAPEPEGEGPQQEGS